MVRPYFATEVQGLERPTLSKREGAWRAKGIANKLARW